MRFAKILCPVDFSPRSRHALAVADSMAARDGGSLTLLYAHNRAPMPVIGFDYVEDAQVEDRHLAAAEREMKAWATGLQTPEDRVHRVVAIGEAIAAINEASRDYDLVVMSTHGRTGISRYMLGSVAERVSRGAECSVLIVKGAGVPAASEAV
ncbi:MAG: universal stress protein [Nannocystis sp.]|nr:universal stress protein [Nannocystis sp.]